MLIQQASQPEQSSTPDPRADMYDLYLGNTKDDIIKQLAAAGQAADPKARKADLVAQLYDAKTAPQAAQTQVAPMMRPESVGVTSGATVAPVSPSASGMPADPAAVTQQSALAQALRARLSPQMPSFDQAVAQPAQAIDPLQMRLLAAMGGR